MKEIDEQRILEIIMALPTADLLLPSKITDPMGADSYYSARTVAMLLLDEEFLKNKIGQEVGNG